MSVPERFAPGHRRSTSLAGSVAINEPDAEPGPSQSGQGQGERALTDVQKDLIKLLKIPQKATNINRDIRFAYYKYRECMKALKAAKQIQEGGRWPRDLPRYTEELVIGLFIAKTSWHHRYINIFPTVEASYPDMVNWLNLPSSSPEEDLDVWGSMRTRYTLEHLKEYISNKGVLKDEEDEAMKELRELAEAQKQETERKQREERERLEQETRERLAQVAAKGKKKKKAGVR